MVFIMEVERGGPPQGKNHVDRMEVDRVATAGVRHTPVPEAAPQQAAEGDRAVPVTVVSRAELEELQRQLEVAQAQAAQLEKRRANDRARVARWREKHPDEDRARNAARMREVRAQQRRQRTGSSG